MPVRIYALAKKLKLDSKELVDICAKAGIPGKGSALASLADDEVAKLEAFLTGSGKSAARAAPAKGDAARSKAAAPAKGRQTEPAVVRREDYIALGGSAGKMKVLPSQPAKTEGDKSEAAVTPGKPAAMIPRLAPLPAAAESPPAEAGPVEPAPQKPDIKLPADVIRSSKAGTKPLAQHLRKHEEKARKESEGTKAKRTSRRSAGTPGREEPPAPTTTRGRPRRGKGADVGSGTEDTDRKILGGREQRQLSRKRTPGANRMGRRDDEGGTRRPRRHMRQRRTGVNTAAARKEKVTVELPCTVRSFSEALGVPAAQVIQVLVREGFLITINAQLDYEQAEMLALELGADIELKDKETIEDAVISAIDSIVDDPASLKPRPPIITFLGHVDHGKTSLLDKIIGTDVVASESGGITQHIRAYQVEKDGRKISFVDTPGHEAFTEMRARGAGVTDIAVLVIAADDGVMPQTEEAISHARAADVPIVVALNKIDLPGVNIDHIYQQLATNELVPAEWSPDGVEVVKTSAMTGQGIEDLLDTLLVTADLHELKANPDRDAVGTCLEAHQEPGRGVVAKMIVQNGTLRVGDVVICGPTAGRIQAMFDPLKTDESLSEAGPAVPVNVTGLDNVPGAGDAFYVLKDIIQARQIAAGRSARSRQEILSGGRQHVTLENLFDHLGEKQEVQTLNLILRADVQGSIEAIRKELSKLQHDEVQIKILQALVGGISVADVHLAHASDAIIIGFNMVADEAARSLAEQYKVDIRRYSIIYKLSEDLRSALEGRLKPEEQEVDLGRALVQRTFTISRVGTVAGCRVIGGKIERNCRVRVIRDNRIIGDYPLDTLRREKNDVKEVRDGMECGMKLSGFNDVKEGDVLETYKIEEVARTLD